MKHIFECHKSHVSSARRQTKQKRQTATALLLKRAKNKHDQESDSYKHDVLLEVAPGQYRLHVFQTMKVYNEESVSAWIMLKVTKVSVF